MKSHTLKRLTVNTSLNQVEFFFWVVRMINQNRLAVKMWQLQEDGIKIPIVICKAKTRQEMQDKTPFKPLCILVPVLSKHEKVDPSPYQGYGLPVYIVKPPLAKLQTILDAYREQAVPKKELKEQPQPQPSPNPDSDAPRPHF